MKENGNATSHWLMLVFASILITSFAMLAHNAFADTISGILQVGQSPTGIGINDQTNKIYVAISGPCYGGCTGSTVSVVDAATNDVIKTMTVGGRPLGVDVNSQTNKIYVANFNSGTVSVIDGTTDTVVSTVAVGSGSVGVGVNPNTNKIYVGNYNSATVSVIDGATNNVVKTIPVGSGTSGIGINSVTNKIYAVSAVSGTVSVIDGATDSVVSTIAVGSNPQSAVVNPNTNKIYVTNNHSNTVSVIDGSTDTVTSTIPVEAGSGGIGIDTATNKIYYPTDAGALQVIDGATDAVIATDTTEETLPDYVGVNPVTNQIYVSDLSSPFVTAYTLSAYNTPSAPQNPKTTASYAQINLSWSAPTSNGGSPITSYKIYRSTSSDTETFLAQIGATNSSYNDTTVANGKTYFYKVTAVNSSGESALSNEASVTAITSTVPSAPTGLGATTVSSSQINLSWTAPSSSGSSAITGYKIERSADGGATWSTIVSNSGSTATSYSDMGLVTSTTYTYRVSAINSAGTSPTSNTASATTNSAPNGTMIFQDNYSSNSGWTQVGTEVTVNSAQFPGVAYFNNAAGGGGVTEERVVKQLPSVLPSRWTADFDYKFTASSIPAHKIFALTNTSVDPQSQSYPNLVYVEHGIGENQLFVVGPLGTASSNIPISQNVQYYVRLDKTPTQLTLYVFSDASRTVQVTGSPVMLGLSQTDYNNNLNYIQHDGCRDCGSARSLTAQVDNTAIYVTPVSGMSPQPPTGLTATAISSAQINLIWTAPASNGGSVMTGYMIQRSTDGGATWSTIIPNSGSTATSYSDMGLAASTTYTYRVSAINSAGTSSPSNSYSATTKNANGSTSLINNLLAYYKFNEASPSPLTNQAASAGSTSALPVADGTNHNSASNWQRPGKIDYAYLYNSTVPSYTTFDSSNSNWNFLHNGTSYSINYWYKLTYPNVPHDMVMLSDADNSDHVGVTIWALQSTQNAIFYTIGFGQVNQWVVSYKTSANVLPSDTNWHMLTFTWNPGAPSNNLRIYVDNILKAQANKTTNSPSSNNPQHSFEIAGRGFNDNTYWDATVDEMSFWKRAISDDERASLYNGGNGATLPTAPQPLTSLVATAVSSSQINLSWSAPSSNGGSAITGYKIERDDGGGFNTIVANTGTTTTTYSDTGLGAGTTHTYRVSAINSAGTGFPSNTASATTSAGLVLSNVRSESGTTSSSPYKITLTNFTAGTGSDRLLVVGISANNNNVASVTFDGVPLARTISSFYNNDAEFWYLTNPSGTANIVVTMAGSTQAVVGAYSFTGVDQTNPISTTTSNHNTVASSPDISITTSNANNWVLDLLSIGGGETLGSPTCMQQWDLTVPNVITGASSSTTVPSPATVTCKWTAGSADLWDDVAVAIKAASGM